LVTKGGSRVRDAQPAAAGSGAEAARSPRRELGDEGNLLGSNEKNIKGETTFRWLPGGFFLEQRAHIDFAGFEIDALELIGYDPETDTFPSTVFSGFSPDPLPYRWDVRDDSVKITVSYAPLDATFTGSWRDDGAFSGGWRPNPGGDESANPPYDISGRRVD
jgi:hypothetical protein